MTTSMYDQLESTPGGASALAAARLRYTMLKHLHEALERSGLSQAELARRLGVRRSAVNQVFRGDGNVRIDTLAEYLHALGMELECALVPAGTPRRRVRAESVTGAPVRITRLDTGAGALPEVVDPVNEAMTPLVDGTPVIISAAAGPRATGEYRDLGTVRVELSA
jgi:transcriptional regulator with XRE-family HTH domain